MKVKMINWENPPDPPECPEDCEFFDGYNGCSAYPGEGCIPSDQDNQGEKENK